MTSIDNLSLVVTCARGFESFLADEIKAIGIPAPEVSSGAVTCKASFIHALKLCLHSAIANKVEVLLAEDHVLNENDVYNLGCKIPLEPWFSPNHSFCIHAHVNDAKFKNSIFLSLKLKDGIVDHMRDVWHQRSSIDTERPDISLSLQVIQRKARVFLELQGDPLNMRGYRRRQIQAPIRETLAASMIAASGWHPQTPFIDPMCGSGTFAIEAALKAIQSAPGIQRHFAFEKLPFFADFQTQWRDLRAAAKEKSKQARKNISLEIRARDIDTGALEIAQNNAQTAGVDEFIRFEKGDVFSLKPVSAAIVTNPPYGERITVNDLELPEFYYQLGRHLRTFPNASLTIISTAELLKKNMHMRPEKRIQTFNGPIACEVATYQLGGAR